MKVPQRLPRGDITSNIYLDAYQSIIIQYASDIIELIMIYLNYNLFLKKSLFIKFFILLIPGRSLYILGFDMGGE